VGLAPPGSALARAAGAGGGPICGLAVGNHAAADDCGERRRLLQQIHGALAERRDAGQGAARRGSGRLGGARLYARARNLHACARIVAAQYGGRFPPDEAELLRLPGVGPYTAAAVAAIAFNQPCVAQDGNVERVVARLFAVAEPLPGAKPKIKAHAQSFLSLERPGDFAQALMDLGATICAPRAPDCENCPLEQSCAARRAGTQLAFPVKAPKAARPHRRGAVFVLRRGDEVLLRSRPAKGLLGGMSEFPSTPLTRDIEPGEARAHAPIKARWREIEGGVRHVFTHFSLELTVFVADAASPEPAPGCRWTRAARLGEEALPTLMRKVAVHAGLILA